MRNKYLFRLFITLCLSTLLYINKANAGDHKNNIATVVPAQNQTSFLSQNNNYAPNCTIVVTMQNVTNVSCAGKNDGKATAYDTTNSNGNGPYTYAWSPSGQTNATAIGLGAGTYTVTVTDHLGCTGTASVTITQPQFIIDRVAGTQSAGNTGDGGPATAADVSIPWGINSDSHGNIFFTNEFTHEVRKIDAAGIIHTIAGDGNFGSSGNNGPATVARLAVPDGVCADVAGNVYISEQANHDVRVINTNGIISIFAGTGVAGFSGDAGQATAAMLHSPGDVKAFGGFIYIADAGNEVIRKVDPTTGIITHVAGVDTISGYSGDGAAAAIAEFDQPLGIAFDAPGNLYITDHGNHVIRMINLAGIITTIAGNGYNAGQPSGGFSGDGGQATAAELDLPNSMAMSSNGNLFITDAGNARVRMVNPAGIISTVAGNAGVGTYPFGEGGYGPNAELNSPAGIITDASGNVIFTDAFHSLVRELHTCGYCSLRALDTIIANSPCAGSNAGSVKAIPFEGLGPDSYHWSTGSTYDTAAGLSPGTYSVTVTDTSGCSATASITLTPTAVTANILGPDSICSGDQITLTATGGSSYSWNNGATTSTITVSPTGDSIYQVIARNGPCTANASHVVDVGTGQSLCALAFYNGITPNGDGHNDVWIIDNIELFPGNTVEIYNRWGTRVWNATGYNNNNIAWRGQDYNNKPLPDGTYFYLVKVNSRTYKGWVQLTR